LGNKDDSLQSTVGTVETEKLSVIIDYLGVVVASLGLTALDSPTYGFVIDQKPAPFQAWSKCREAIDAGTPENTLTDSPNRFQ
jgi:hypothetical protein